MKNRCALLIGFPLVAAGCQQPKATALNYRVARFSGATEAAVYDAARQALRGHFPVLRTDRASGVLEGAPVEAVGGGAGTRLGDVVAVPRRYRRVAEMRVETAGSTVKVYCKVLVQEYDTQAHRMYRAEHALHDLPTGTPAERDGATTIEQNSVWRTRRRDRALENDILRELQEHVAGAEVL